MNYELSQEEVEKYLLQLSNDELKQLTNELLARSLRVIKRIVFEIKEKNMESEKFSIDPIDVLIELSDGTHDLPIYLKQFEQGEDCSQEIVLNLYVLYSAYYEREKLTNFPKSLHSMDQELQPTINKINSN